MKNIINNTPFAIGGLTLGLLALGNLIKPYSQMARTFCGIVAGALLLLIIIKIILKPHAFVEDWNKAPVAGVLATLPMSILISTTYIISFSRSIAWGLWWLGLLTHGIMIILFSLKYVKSFSIKNVFPSFFVMYVGIVCATVSSPVVGTASIGRTIFYFGLLTYAIWLPLITYRVLVIKNIPKPAVPTIAIFAAPAGLLLTGYQVTFFNMNSTLYYALVILSILMYGIVLISLPRILKLQFMPSFSALTFPLVITTLGLSPLLTSHVALKYIHGIMTLFVVVVVSFVLTQYLKYMTTRH